jgi:hypothetical protein
LGNIFRSFEEKAGGRYGFDTTVIWPRLYPLVNERLLAGINDLRDHLDLMARLFWLGWITTITSLAFLATHTIWLLVPFLTAIMTLLSYEQIKRYTISYGILIETAFDLHHLDLRKALHLALPEDITEEIENNQELSRGLATARLSKLKYSPQ